MMGLAVLAALLAAEPAPPAAALPPTVAAPPPTPMLEEDFGEPQIRAAFQAAEAQRGPLEGRWRLALADGQPLFLFQIADSGGAPDPRAASPQAPQIEGAWRDLRRPNALDASGFVARVSHDAAGLSILFYEGAGRQAQSIRLGADAGGVWTGELAAGGGRRSRVMMTRD